MSEQTASPISCGTHAMLRACRTFMPAGAVFDDYDICARYGRDCGFVERMPQGVLLVDSIDQLRHIVVLANEYAVPIHPISRGKNWGYGSAAPFLSSCVVVDLHRMNQIIEVNEELAYAVVEPGVSQQQLYDYLVEHDLPLDMDVTGSSPDASLLGNLVERGYGQTTYGDHFLHSSGMEVLLANGSIIQTGFGHFKNSKSHHLYKWGLGPYLDGIFTQSNFGIVTRVGIWLMPKPEQVGLLTFKIKNDQLLSEVLPILRTLKLRGILPATVHVSNNVRLLSCFTQHPLTGELRTAALSDASLDQLCARYQIDRWNCFTSLKGSPREIRTALAEVRKALRSHVKVDLITQTSVFRSRRFGPFYRWVTGRDTARTEMLLNLVSGKPTFGPTLGAFWRNPQRPSTSPPDPLRDRCGLAWLAPMFPCSKREITQFLKITGRICQQYGFETNLTLTMLSERALCATVGVAFARDREQDQAQDCYDMLMSTYVEAGYIPYRHGINVEPWRDSLFRRDDPFWQVCRTIKQALDPNGILSPGKYGL